MVGPNYISYNDWEAQAGVRRKRRRLRMMLILGVVLFAVFGLLVGAANNRLPVSSQPEAPRALKPEWWGDTAGEGKISQSSISRSQSRQGPRMRLNPSLHSAM